MRGTSISFLAEDAVDYGVHGAIVLQHILFHLRNNIDNPKVYFDGKFWMFKKYKQFLVQYPFFTTRQIEYAINQLVAKGVIEKGHHAKNKNDSTTWYTLTDSNYEKYIGEIGAKDDQMFDTEFPQNCEPGPANCEPGPANCEPIPYIVEKVCRTRLYCTRKDALGIIELWNKKGGRPVEGDEILLNKIVSKSHYQKIPPDHLTNAINNYFETINHPNSYYKNKYSIQLFLGLIGRGHWERFTPDNYDLTLYVKNTDKDNLFTEEENEHGRKYLESLKS